MNETVTQDHLGTFDAISFWKYGIPLSHRILLMVGVVVFACTVVSVLVDLMRFRNSASR
jgi:hypothetical protein